jgi:hypothetical protein
LEGLSWNDSRPRTSPNPGSCWQVRPHHRQTLWLPEEQSPPAVWASRTRSALSGRNDLREGVNFTFKVEMFYSDKDKAVTDAIDLAPIVVLRAEDRDLFSHKRDPESTTDWDIFFAEERHCNRCDAVICLFNHVSRSDSRCDRPCLKGDGLVLVWV